VHRGWGSKTDRPASFQNAYISEKIKVERIPEEIWGNREWLMENCKKYGVSICSRMAGVRKNSLWTKLKGLGIPIRSSAEVCGSKNKYCTREWLEENYEIEKHNLLELAEIAKVNTYTIMNWLVKFGIPIRDTYECQYGELSVNYGKERPELAGKVVVKGPKKSYIKKVVAKINATGPKNSLDASTNDSADSELSAEAGSRKIC